MEDTEAHIINNHLERTLVLIKPDGLRRSLAFELLTRFERAGLKVVALRMARATPKLAGQHYSYEDIAVRHGEEIRNQLIEYLTEGPVIAAVFEGVEAVQVIRKLCGSTEPTSASPGTIRGDYCHHGYQLCNDVGKAIQNLIHASATLEEARQEISLWFDENELHSYSTNNEGEHYLSSSV